MSQIATIAMGAMNVAMTVISTLLVEAAGRKTLLLVGFGGMFIDTILLTVALLIVVSCTHFRLLFFVFQRSLYLHMYLGLSTCIPTYS